MLQIKYVYTQSEQPIKHPGYLFKIGENSLYFQAASLCCCSWTAPIVVQQKKMGKHKPWDLALPHSAFNHATKLVLTSGCQFQEVAEQSNTDTPNRTSEICRGRSDFQNHHLTSSSHKEEEEEEAFFCVLLSNAVGMTSGIWTTCVFGLASTGFNLSAWQFHCVQTWSY